MQLTKISYLAAAAATALAVSACDDRRENGVIPADSADRRVADESSSAIVPAPTRNALVRVINASPTSSTLEVRADSARRLPVVRYKTVGEYQAIDDNWIKFEISGKARGTWRPLDTNRELLIDGRRYSLVVMDTKEGTEYETRVLRDDVTPDAGRAQVRVIHAAQGLGEIDITADGGSTLFGGVNHSSEAGFKAVDVWTGALQIRGENDDRVLHTINGVRFDMGRAYTIIVTRNAKGAIDHFLFEEAVRS
jgi:hypothetical protein